MLLIICQNKRLARSVSDTFHYMSILSYGATPHEALSEVSSMYRAALIINPTSFPDISDYVSRIKRYKSDLPIFAITDDTPPPHYPDIFDGVFTKTTFTPSLAKKIITYANNNNRARIGDYFLSGFDASSDNVGVHYFNTSINLTKTEAMILRYLIVSYPEPQKAEKILKYAFKSGRAPEPASIRTHISIMNKKMEERIGSKMIALEPRRGYIVVTPQYLENKKTEVKSTSV